MWLSTAQDAANGTLHISESHHLHVLLNRHSVCVCVHIDKWGLSRVPLYMQQPLYSPGALGQSASFKTQTSLQKQLYCLSFPDRKVALEVPIGHYQHSPHTIPDLWVCVCVSSAWVGLAMPGRGGVVSLMFGWCLGCLAKNGTVWSTVVSLVKGMVPTATEHQ